MFLETCILKLQKDIKTIRRVKLFIDWPFVVYEYMLSSFHKRKPFDAILGRIASTHDKVALPVSVLFVVFNVQK